MLIYSIAFLLGAASINFWSALLSIKIILLIGIFASYLLIQRLAVFKLLGLFLCGIILTQVAAHRLPWFDKRYFNQRVEFECSGIIASIPEKQERSIRFLFQTKKGLFYINWYGAYHTMKPGQRWHLRLRLIPVRNYHNEAGFDLTRWLMLQGVSAKGYVRYSKQNRLVEDTGYTKYPLLRYRYEKQQHIKNIHIPNWEVISALTMGLRNAMPDEYWQLLRKTNTSHLLAISGLHIGMIAGLIFMLFNFLWRQSMWLTNLCPAPIAASYPALVSAFLYALIAGWSLPTQRAFIMVSVGLLGLIRRKAVFTWQSFSIAIFAVVLFQPLAVMTIGFWLSFLAAFSLIYVLSQRRHVKWIWLQTQWAVTLFLFPWVLLFFKELALLGWVVNLAAIPLVSFITLPCALLGVFLPAFNNIFLYISSVSIDALMLLLKCFANLPMLTWYSPPHANLVLALAIVGLLVVLLPRGMPGKWFGVIMLLPALLQQPLQVKKGEAYIQLLDVQHGLAILIRTKTHALLYDIGDPFITRSVLLPFLKQQGISSVDKVIISHADFDHLGALNTMLFFYPHARLESSEDLYAQQPTHLCRSGRQWQWDNVSFKYLYPREPYFDAKNDNSCVLQIRTGTQTLLLTGDISKRAEKRMLTELKQAQSIMLVPHHGSGTSSSIKLLKTAAPKAVVVSSSRPLSEISVQRYMDRDISIWSTYEQGQINIKLMREKFIIQSYRQMMGKVWYDVSLEKRQPKMTAYE